MMRWWWFGPAVTRQGIRAQLEAMHGVGIGGVELSVVYPLSADDNLSYLSPAFLEMITYTAELTERLGLRLDLTLGSGWPFGGPHISPDLATRQLTVRDLPLPLDAPLELGHDENLHLAVILDEQETALGTVAADELLARVPELDGQTLRLLLDKPTGGQVKNAAVGAAGPWLDHYCEEALEQHLSAVGEPLLQAAGTERVTAIFCDSLELAHASWTADFLRQFEARRGYDLRPHLADLLAGDGDRQHRIRHDYGCTLTDLLNEAFLRPLQNFAHRHGVRSRVQTYGQPPANLRSYCYVDIPEGEAARAADHQDMRNRADWTEITPCRLASSAAHQQGKREVSAEIWTWLHSPPFAATPLDVKSEADQYILQGINRFIGHGWSYSEPDAPPPGRTFYAATNFNTFNTWFPVMGELSAYLQRICGAMSHGQPVVDLAVYLPQHDAWDDFQVRQTMPELIFSKALLERLGHELPVELLRRGYTFDLIDDDGVAELAAGCGPAYRAVLLPDIQRLPLATAECLRGLVDQGLPLAAIGRLPDSSPGLLGAGEASAAVQQIIQELFIGESAQALHVASAGELERLRPLAAPTVSMQRPTADLGVIHRRTEGEQLTFFANTSNRPLSTVVRLRELPFAHLSLWDPLHDQVYALPTSLEQRLELAPFESGIIVMSDEPAPATPGWETERRIKLDAGWELTLSGTEQRFSLDRLVSWTELPGAAHYSGAGIYRKQVSLSGDWSADHQRVVLTLPNGEPVEPFRLNPERRNMGHIAWLDTPLKDAALVRVNGDQVGALYCPPYWLDLTPYLQPGDNELELTVYNRRVNELASQPTEPPGHPHGADWRGVHDLEFVRAEPAGLTGPIEILIQRCKSG